MKNKLNIRKNTYLLFLLVNIFLSACVRSNEQSGQALTSFKDDLANAEYILDATNTGKAPLKDGYFEETSAPDSVSINRVKLNEQKAFGDINGDGLEDAAVTLNVESGGSGTFTYLALVLNENGEVKPLPAVFLGDRIKIRSMSIESNIIKVDLYTHTENEPLSSEPTVEETLRYSLKNDGRILIE